ncbi:MAG: YggS family pyridoxal phosphate-dependent enzyme [Burkholderiales bacterium]|nr:YggS family pyridoxal phosphate-dependent enzyme [Burkholderiales bacterium]
MPSAPAIAKNLRETRELMDLACQRAGRRPESVRLLAVSKTFAADDVAAAHAAGQTAFGENYVQEGVAKVAALAALGLEWHFIGPIQSNKTRPIAEHFSWVHSIDRLKIAERLSAQRPAHLPDLQVCLQVNISGETSKSGIESAAILRLAREVAALPRLRLRGLMTIPRPAATLAEQRAPFRELRLLLEAINAAGIGCDTLSMGMSADLEAAILEGATIVRVGTAIFGARSATG